MLGAMRFDLVDQVLERSDERIVTIKCVTGAEEYLADHFPTFPVLPGVLMLEAMVQAARRLLSERDGSESRHVLGRVRALKYGAFVRPGDAIRIEVSLLSGGKEGSADLPDGAFDFRGSGEVLRPDQPAGEAPPTCVSGRFLLRPARVEAGRVGAESPK